MKKNLHRTPNNKEFNWEKWSKLNKLIPEKGWVWQNIRTGIAEGTDWVEQQIYYDMLYTFRLGALSPYAKGLLEGKLLGTKCPKCGDVFVPPRKICGKCNEIISLDENWVDLLDTGTLVNYTITPYKVNDKRGRKAKDHIVGMVNIDGSNTSIVNSLNIASAEIKTGMKVKIEWADKPKGGPSDIKGFRRAEGGEQ